MMPLLHRPTPGSMDVAAVAQSAGGTPALSGDEGPAFVLATAVTAPYMRDESMFGHDSSGCKVLLPGGARCTAW